MVFATCHPDRKHLAQGLCATCYAQKRYSRNKAKQISRSRAWAAENRKSHRLANQKHRLKTRYGLSPEELSRLKFLQGGVCPVCRIRPASDVDHDHSTGKVRAILCGSCNRGLGLFFDSEEVLIRAADYLSVWRTP